MTLMHPPKLNGPPNDGWTGLRDAYGNPVPDWIPYYQAVVGRDPHGWPFGMMLPNPNYKPGSQPFKQEVPTNPAPPPPHIRFTFDTVGQTIVRTIGLCRTPLKTIWVQGISSSGDSLAEGVTTMTFAAAMCAPIDPTEGGTVAAMWDGASLIFDPAQGGAIAPEEWDPDDADALLTSLSNVTIYPGTEYQLPDPRIIADKGLTVANAFRGIRYIVFPDYPIKHGLPNLSSSWKSPGQRQQDPVAAEFPAGAG